MRMKTAVIIVISVVSPVLLVANGDKTLGMDLQYWQW